MKRVAASDNLWLWTSPSPISRPWSRSPRPCTSAAPRTGCTFAAGAEQAAPEDRGARRRSAAGAALPGRAPDRSGPAARRARAAAAAGIGGRGGALAARRARRGGPAADRLRHRQHPRPAARRPARASAALPDVQLQLRDMSTPDQMGASPTARLTSASCVSRSRAIASSSARCSTSVSCWRLGPRSPWTARTGLRSVAASRSSSSRSRSASFYDHALSVCAAAGFAPRIVQEASELFTVLSLVGAGLGVSLVPRSAALMRLPGVRFRELTPGSGLEHRRGLAPRCRRRAARQGVRGDGASSGPEATVRMRGPATRSHATCRGTESASLHAAETRRLIAARSRPAEADGCKLRTGASARHPQHTPRCSAEARRPPTAGPWAWPSDANLQRGPLLRRGLDIEEATVRRRWRALAMAAGVPSPARAQTCTLEPPPPFAGKWFRSHSRRS